jgi:hypothetical protein
LPNDFQFANGRSANAINDACQIVGLDRSGYAFEYYNGRFTSLPSLNEATGINAAGQIVGQINNMGLPHAAL